MAESNRGHEQPAPATVIALVGLLALLGVSGLVGGVGLLAGVIEPPLDLLEGSPFSDYVIPGLSLFTFLGVLPLVAAYGLTRRRLWAWPSVLAVGAAVLVWFAVQASVVGWGAALQWFYLLVGLAILGTALLPSVRRYGRVPAVLTRIGG